MKLAYASTYDPRDIGAWSGLGTHILGALRDAECEVEVVMGSTDRPSLVSLVKERTYRHALSRNYLAEREPSVVRRNARRVERALLSGSYDVLFSPGTLATAFVQTDVPSVFWTDATFAGITDFYPRYSHLCRESIREGNRIEASALSRCRLAIYSSEWAAGTALAHYDVDPAIVKVVPFGANLECRRDLHDVAEIVRRRSQTVCKLLFLGVDWSRKGGEIALAAATLLNQRGVRAELHVVGCAPPIGVPGFVKIHGFVSKDTAQGRQRLDRMLAEAHFLILPSRAECYGVVFAEASSFGLPSLATRVGGIPTAIRDGSNGQTFALDDGPEAYCDYIEGLWTDKAAYGKLCLSSFAEYSERLNWAVAGRTVRALMEEHCG